MQQNIIAALGEGSCAHNEITLYSIRFAHSKRTSNSFPG